MTHGTRLFLLRGGPRRVPRAQPTRQTDPTPARRPSDGLTQRLRFNSRRMETRSFLTVQRTAQSLVLQRVNTIRRVVAGLRSAKLGGNATLRRSQRTVPLRPVSGSVLSTGARSEMCVQVGRGLGPRQIQRRHAGALSSRAGIVLQAVVVESAVPPQGIQKIVEQSSRALQCARSDASEVALRNLDSVAQEVAYTGWWGAAKTFPKRHPFIANLFLSVIGYGLADYSVQRMQGEEIDRKRVASFACFGLVQGCVSWIVFVNIFPKFAPASVRFSNLSFAEKLRNTRGQIDVLKQVCLDNFFYTPLIFFPIFYSCKAVFQGWHGEPLHVHALQAARKYSDNIVEDNIASCKVWIWADLLIFTVPAWMRMLVFQGVSFSFTMILSHMRGSSEAMTATSTGKDVRWSAHLWKLCRDLQAALPTVQVSFSM